ncbi:hypothetical protein [Paractinoplanes durhamensis]|uniref:PknH-like extracellular domain-containing protein n=1 Tax=Paractinoplanes durhamensis TaxID=113563 RepID=A0ABQ3YT16_9ACTN|nr:hypothetical protein [Actinoplanes durhamensis]GIE00669.1 hypothetical protein Adu01nite_20190 [Actinoplanes durhamensis]
MSNELKRAFAALSDDAGRGRLEPAATVRRRSDRRRAVTAVAGTLTAAVLVAGVLVGSRLVLAGPPAPVPAVSMPPVSLPPSLPPSPPSADPGTTSPSSSPSSPAPRSIPSSLPAKAFLQASDVPGKIKDGPQRLGAGDQPLPDFCGNSYDQGAKAGIRATQVLYFTGPGDPPDSTPKAAVYQDILVFQGSAAESFMDDLRAAVQDCATDGDVKSYVRGSLGVGDESFLIERTSPATDDAGEPVGGELFHLYYAVVRVGDAVAFVSDTGWESGSADRADAVHLGERAAARLSAWRR